MKTARERAEEKLAEKREYVKEQVENGSLVIRQMTDEERERYPPRPVAPKRFGKRWFVREREGLIARISQIRRATADAAERRTSAEAESAAATEQDQIRALEARVSELEDMLQGLQDSVHRESLRTNKRIVGLESQIQPAALSRALSEDARERGL
jgi:hypothetical protein